MGEWNVIADVEEKARFRGDSAPAMRLWGQVGCSIVQFKHSCIFAFELRLSMFIANILSQVRRCNNINECRFSAFKK